MIKKEALVIGLGLSGCVAARLLADAGYQVTCFEKESNIGGSLIELTGSNGIRFQYFGPHIFHTNSENIYAYLKRFGSFYPYSHRVMVNTSDKTVPLPLNEHSLKTLWGDIRARNLISRIHAVFGDVKRVPVDKLIDSKDPELIDLGRYIIENILISNINLKDGSAFQALDDSYKNDAFVDTSDNDCYYEDKYQAMPVNGFIPILDNMLSHPDISVFMNMDALNRVSVLEESGTILLDGAPFKGPVVFTPSIDALFGSRYGALEYRYSNYSVETLDIEFKNENAVIITPKDKDVIRTYESKYMTLQDESGTTIVKESPYFIMSSGAMEPFEPVHSEENLARYEKYAKLATQFRQLHLLGHLACFKNMSIEDCVEQAMAFLAAL